MVNWISNSWGIGTSAVESFVGDRVNAGANDVFQLGSSSAGSAGGVNNGFDSFDGKDGYDKIIVSPKSGYYWTAVMIADNGLQNVEEIVNYNTNGGPAPIYFAGTVDFGDVIALGSNMKIYGRDNDNTFHGGIVGEYVEGDAGNDTLYGNGGNDTLYGDTADNPWAVSWSAAGNDHLLGGDGDDILHGQGGDDILNGGSGTNALWGEAGADQFQFTDANDHSVVRDFEVGVDKIQIDTSIAVDFSSLSISDTVDGDAYITAGDIEITLLGVSATSISSSDFDFGLFA